MKIDSHQHFWNPARGDYDWMPKGDPVLDLVYRPSDLTATLAHHQIDGTVLVQAAATVAETLGVRVKRLGAPRIPVGYAPVLEAVARVSADQIVAAAQDCLKPVTR